MCMGEGEAKKKPASKSPTRGRLHARCSMPVLLRRRVSQGDEGSWVVVVMLGRLNGAGALVAQAGKWVGPDS